MLRKGGGGPKRCARAHAPARYANESLVITSPVGSSTHSKPLKEFAASSVLCPTTTSSATWQYANWWNW